MSKRKRRSYRRSNKGIGLGELPVQKFNKKEAVNGALAAVLAAGGLFIAAKGSGWLDKTINKNNSKAMGIFSPGLLTLAGIAAATFTKDAVKAFGHGLAAGGLIKVIEKVSGKENLLAGTDDDQPLMLPGVGDIGFADLPELSHYSENPEADVTTTGNDPQYRMGQPSEILSGDDEIIAY